MHKLRPPAMELREFYYFLTLSKHKSISAAAQELGIAQPSLSVCIANLESRLDVQLVVRGSSGAQLTEAGHALAQLAADVIQSVDGALDRIRELGTVANGTVSLGMPPSLSAILSVPLLETVQSEHASVKLKIIEAMDGHILDWVRSDQLDLGCVYEHPDAKEISSRPLFKEQLLLATAPDNWAGEIGANGFAVKPIKAAALQDLPLAMPRGAHGARRMIDKALKRYGIKLNVVTEIDSLPQMLGMVERASGYSLVPQRAVFQHLASGTLALVPVVAPTIDQTTYLARKRSRPVTRASSVVEEAMMTVLREVIRRYRLNLEVY